MINLACEYLAVSTVSEQPSLAYRIPNPLTTCSSMVQVWSMDTSVSDDFGISTGTKKGGGMRFDLALLTDIEVIQLKWCPRGGTKEDTNLHATPAGNGEDLTLERLGLIACLSTQGFLSIYDIPRPESARKKSAAAADDLVFSKIVPSTAQRSQLTLFSVKRKAPLLSFELGNVPITCFDWASHGRIVAGCATGHVAVFDIEDALKDGKPSSMFFWHLYNSCGTLADLDATVDPTAFFPVHGVDITAIAAIRQPLLQTEGKLAMLEESPRIATTSLDGSCRMVDLRDTANVYNFGHERGMSPGFLNAVPFLWYLGGLTCFSRSRSQCFSVSAICRLSSIR